MKAQYRSMLGVALFVPLAAMLLATFACLPVPVGDPEQSKMDAALAGIYRGTPTDPADKTNTLALLRPWDAKTYLLEYVTVETKDGKEVRQMQHFKAWLTTIAEKTFLTAAPMDDLKFALGDDDKKPFWVVLRLDKVAAGLEVRMVNPDSEYLKGLTKREEFEAAIKAHVSDQPLYGDALTFKKLGKEDQPLIDEVLSKFNSK